MSRLLPIAACALVFTLAMPAQTLGPSIPSQHDRGAAVKAYIAGAHAIEEHDTHTAFDAFSKAAALDPTNEDYKNAVVIAKAHFVTDLIQQAEKARILGHNDIVHARLAEALAVDPTNPIVAQHVDDITELGGGPLKTDDITSTIADAIRLEPASGKRSFHVRADGETLLRQVLSAYGIAPSSSRPTPSSCRSILIESSSLRTRNKIGPSLSGSCWRLSTCPDSTRRSSPMSAISRAMCSRSRRSP
jgi:hypothetical protein